MNDRHLYLIRHGQYDLSEKGKLGGSLTQKGREQAYLTGLALQEFPIDTLHYSSMPRAAETAQLIAESLPGVLLRRSRALWECVPSVPPRFAEHFTSLPANHVERCQKRLDTVYSKYFKPARGEEKHEALVCHGNVIRYLVCRALDVGAHTWANLLIFNCGISRVLIEGSGNIFLVGHSDIGHIPHDLRTET